MAKNYVENLGEEASKGMREEAKSGIWPSVAPMGYQNIHGRRRQTDDRSSRNSRAGDSKDLRVVRNW
jgi:hypothetical protein